MTVTTSVTETTDTRTLLGVGVKSNAATSPPQRRDPDWEEYSAAYLEAHPEVSAAVPRWTDELEFLDIEDEVEGTVFAFSRTIRDVEIYGGGRLHPDGRVELYDNGVPNIYIRDELRADQDPDIARWALDVAQDLITAATLLRAEPKLLRRSADVDAELQSLDI